MKNTKCELIRGSLWGRDTREFNDRENGLIAKLTKPGDYTEAERWLRMDTMTKPTLIEYGLSIVDEFIPSFRRLSTPEPLVFCLALAESPGSVRVWVYALVVALADFRKTHSECFTLAELLDNYMHGVRPDENAVECAIDDWWPTGEATAWERLNIQLEKAG